MTRVDPITIEFPAPTPPWSVNARMHWTRERRLKAAWRAAAARAARNVPAASGPVDVHVTIPFTRGGRRDPHNYTGTVVKHVIDGLGPETRTAYRGKVSWHPGAGLWPDDTPEHVRVLEPTLTVGGPVRVTITPR